jgi:hypothetical protein
MIFKSFVFIYLNTPILTPLPFPRRGARRAGWFLSSSSLFPETLPKVKKPSEGAGCSFPRCLTLSLVSDIFFRNTSSILIPPPAKEG